MEIKTKVMYKRLKASFISGIGGILMSIILFSVITNGSLEFAKERSLETIFAILAFGCYSAGVVGITWKD